MRRTVAAVLVGAIFAAAHAASVAVINPKKPEGLSLGELGVMLDVMAREIDKSSAFEVMAQDAEQQLLASKGKERADACPDADCIGEIGTMLSVNYVAALSIEHNGESYMVKMTMFDVGSGKVIAEAGGEFNGPKSQIVLTFVPEQAKELVRIAEPLAEARGSDAPELAAAPAPEEKPAAVAPEKTPAPAKPVSVSMPAAAPSPAAPAASPQPVGQQKQRTRSFLKSPGFWVPVALVIAVPVGIAVYMRQSREEPAPASTEMPFPETPTRPTMYPDGGPAQ